jgi:hypothetical protein
MRHHQRRGLGRDGRRHAPVVDKARLDAKESAIDSGPGHESARPRPSGVRFKSSISSVMTLKRRRM